MTIRIAINGYGRIGRNILKAHYTLKSHPDIQIVAINDLGNLSVNAHLTRYDSVHGPFQQNIAVEEENKLVINNDRIAFFCERDPSKLPWAELDIDVVLECSGCFRTRDKANLHIQAGAKKVLISAPAGKDVDATVVYGVNHSTLKPEDHIVSNASCTTNCLAPLVKPLHQSIGIESGIMTTVHAYTNDQVLTDSYHSDLHRSRAAGTSLIPTKTGAATAIDQVIPELKGKLDGLAIRVPTPNVSLVDLTFQGARSTTVEEVHSLLKAASKAELKGVLAYNEEPLVSIDFNHHPASSIYDATQTRVVEKLVKVLAWYDNEWGFSNRMLDTAKAMLAN